MKKSECGNGGSLFEEAFYRLTYRCKTLVAFWTLTWCVKTLVQSPNLTNKQLNRPMEIDDLFMIYIALKHGDFPVRYVKKREGNMS